MDWQDAELHRYSRNIMLPEIGGAGQELLLQSSVLVIGAGGLGSPALWYLAAAGIGTLGIIDHDTVELSNLQRQTLHTVASIGQNKTESAKARLLHLNPGITLHTHQERLTGDNIAHIAAPYQLVVEGSDNVATRFLVADFCHRSGKTLVSAAVNGFSGQLSTFKSYLGDPHPCYRCLYPVPPPEEFACRCTDSGVLGAVAGVMGSLQATEVVKELLHIGESLSGHLLTYEALSGHFRKRRLPKDPHCSLCT